MLVYYTLPVHICFYNRQAILNTTHRTFDFRTLVVAMIDILSIFTHKTKHSLCTLTIMMNERLTIYSTQIKYDHDCVVYK